MLFMNESRRLLRENNVQGSPGSPVVWCEERCVCWNVAWRPSNCTPTWWWLVTIQHDVSLYFNTSLECGNTSERTHSTLS